MPSQSIARMGDPCGGTIIASATKMTVNGLAVALLGDSVSPHGDSPHSNATLVQGSPKITVENKAVVVVTNAASCGHAVSGGAANAKAAPG